MSINPYESPPAVEERGGSRTRGRTVSAGRMAYNGLVVGTFQGLAFGAVAGGLIAAMFVMQASFLSLPAPSRFAESAVQSAVEGVFAGALIGFALLTPLAAVLGVVLAMTSLHRRAFAVIAMILAGIAFALVGAAAAGWFSVPGFLLSGCVGIVCGQTLARSLSALGTRDHATVRRRPRID